MPNIQKVWMKDVEFSVYYPVVKRREESLSRFPPPGSGPPFPPLYRGVLCLNPGGDCVLRDSSSGSFLVHIHT